MSGNRFTQRGFPFAELLLLLATITLLLQVFPSLLFIFVAAVKFQNWPRHIWLTVNAIIAFTLLAFRFMPEIIASWVAHRRREKAMRETREKQRAVSDERKSLARIRESRKRRVY